MTPTDTVRAIGLGLLTIVLLACAGAPGSSAEPDPASPGPSAAPPVEATAAPDLVAAITFREEMGLRADLAWVQAVAANPDATMDWGVPLLPFETAELERRQTGEGELVGAVQAYLAEHPDVNGGLYIDQAAGGVVTVLVTDDPTPHETALRELVGADARLAVRQVRWTEAALNDLQERLFTDPAFFASIPAFVSSASTDIIGNQVVLDISSAAPDAAQRIADHVSAEDGQLKIVSDGTGILLMPVGRIEGRVLAPAGTDFAALSPQFESDVPIGARDAVGIAVAPNGTFTIEHLPPTGYRVYLLELGPNGNREAGEVRVVVPPGGVAVAEIAYQAP